MDGLQASPIALLASLSPVRNDYEIEMGTFQEATDPGTTTFGEWKSYVERFTPKLVDFFTAVFCDFMKITYLIPKLLPFTQ